MTYWKSWTTFQTFKALCLTLKRHQIWDQVKQGIPHRGHYNWHLASDSIKWLKWEKAVLEVSGIHPVWGSKSDHGHPELHPEITATLETWIWITGTLPIYQREKEGEGGGCFFTFGLTLPQAAIESANWYQRWNSPNASFIARSKHWRRETEMGWGEEMYET